MEVTITEGKRYQGKSNRQWMVDIKQWKRIIQLKKMTEDSKSLETPQKEWS